MHREDTRSCRFCGETLLDSGPSFGLWGYALARATPFDLPSNPPQGLKFLDELTLKSMFNLSADIGPVPVEINRLDNQALVRYYEGEWRRFE